MASQIDTVRKLHGPSLVKVPNSYDVDVICAHCTQVVSSALEKAGVETSPEVAYPCETTLASGVSESAANTESAKIRTTYFDGRYAELTDEIEYIDTVRALLSGDNDQPAPAADPEEKTEPAAEAKPDPDPEEKPEPAKPKRAPRKKSAAAPEKPAEEPTPEPADDPEPPADEPSADDWDF